MAKVLAPKPSPRTQEKSKEGLASSTALDKRILLEAKIADTEQRLGSGHIEVAKLLSSLAILYGEEGLLDKKRKVLERALPIYLAQYGPKDPTVLLLRDELEAVGHPNPDVLLQKAADAPSTDIILRDNSALTAVAAALAERWAHISDDRKEALWRKQADRDISALQQQLDDNKMERNKLAQQIAALEEEHAARMREYEQQFGHELIELQSRIESLQDERDRLQLARSEDVSVHTDAAMAARLREVQDALTKAEKAYEALQDDSQKKQKEALAELKKEKKKVVTLMKDKETIEHEKKKLEIQLNALQRNKSVSALASMGAALETSIFGVKAAAETLMKNLADQKTEEKKEIDKLAENSRNLKGKIDELQAGSLGLRSQIAELKKKLEESDRLHKQEQTALQRHPTLDCRA